MTMGVCVGVNAAEGLFGSHTSLGMIYLLTPLGVYSTIAPCNVMGLS